MESEESRHSKARIWRSAAPSAPALFFVLHPAVVAHIRFLYNKEGRIAPEVTVHMNNRTSITIRTCG